MVRRWVASAARQTQVRTRPSSKLVTSDSTWSCRICIHWRFVTLDAGACYPADASKMSVQRFAFSADVLRCSKSELRSLPPSGCQSDRRDSGRAGLRPWSAACATRRSPCTATTGSTSGAEGKQDGMRTGIYLAFYLGYAALAEALIRGSPRRSDGECFLGAEVGRELL